MPLETGVSATGSPRLDCGGPDACAVAVEAPSGAVGQRLSELVLATWDGTEWRTERPEVPGSSATVEDVACGGPASCLVIVRTSADRVALGWDGSRWTLLAAPLAVPETALVASSVRLSCATPSFCALLVGSFNTSAPELSVQTWNGTAWSFTPAPPPPPEGAAAVVTRDIDCPAADRCVAAGYRVAPQGLGLSADIAFIWNGSSWSRHLMYQGLVIVASYALSCVTIDRCLAVTGGSLIDYVSSQVYGLAGGRAGWWPTRSPVIGARASGKVAVRAVSCAGDWCQVVGAMRSGDPTAPGLEPVALRYRL